jgi:hypothetical protein
MSEFYQETLEDEPIRNDTPLTPVDEQFKNILTDCKRSIYMGIVFAQPEESPEAQDTQLLDKYLQSLSALYAIMNSLPNLPVESIDWSAQPWSVIPQGAYDKTQAALLWYKNYLQKNNRSIDKIPYRDYISNVLHVHPYSQVPNPDED